MTTPAEAGSERPPRPSPFAFPSDTTFRFALLVAAVLGATLYVWSWMWSVFADRPRIVVELRDCLLTPVPPGDLDARARVARTCNEQAFGDSAAWMVGGAVLVLGLAVVLLLAWPAVKDRRGGFRPLEADDAPDVLATLGELSREAGLDREPRWVWNPLRRGATGVAFGRPGRATIGLTGGLVVAHATDRDAFRAIVRHELAHVRNRDVTVTYATLALWYAFLLAAVVPFLVTLVDEGSVALSVAWRLLALAALVYLTRNAVLRSREVYADLRASVPDGPDGALARVVSTLPGGSDSLLRRLLAVHPPPARRTAALEDTRPLFELGRLEAFAAGLAATINFDSVHTLVSWWIVDPVDVGFVSALVFAPLVVGAAGVALWRDRLGALAGDTERQAVWPVALALTAGFLVGPELSLLDAFDDTERGLLASLLRGDGAIWVAALLALVLLLLAWVGGGSWVWLRARAARRAPAVWVAGLAVAAGALTIVLGAYYTLRSLAETITVTKEANALLHAQVDEVAWAGPLWLWQLVQDPVTLVLVDRPLIPLAVVALWAFPLAAALVRDRRTGEAPWAFLDPGGRIEAERPRVALARPLLVGAGGGLAFLAALALARAAAHAFVGWDTRSEDLFLVAFGHWQLVLAILAQVGAAVVATALARDATRLAEGLCAASVTATIAVAAIVTGPSVAGCVDPLALRPGPCAWDVSGSWAWDLWRQLVTQGAVAAVAAGVLVLAASALFRTRPRAQRLEPLDTASPPLVR
jgi:Zn-dependent protease with chaperone function